MQWKYVQCNYFVRRLHYAAGGSPELHIYFPMHRIPKNIYGSFEISSLTHGPSALPTLVRPKTQTPVGFVYSGGARARKVRLLFGYPSSEKVKRR